MMKDDPLDTNGKKQQSTTSPYLTTKDAAVRLRLKPATLNKWRLEGRGPAFREHGRRIIYHIDDLDAWSEDQIRHQSQANGDQDSNSSSTKRGAI